jgi:hypothetical protein
VGSGEMCQSAEGRNRSPAQYIASRILDAVRRWAKTALCVPRSLSSASYNDQRPEKQRVGRETTGPAQDQAVFCSRSAATFQVSVSASAFDGDQAARCCG